MSNGRFPVTVQITLAVKIPMSLGEREAWEGSVLSDKEASEQKVPAGEGLEGSFE